MSLPEETAGLVTRERTLIRTLKAAANVGKILLEEYINIGREPIDRTANFVEGIALKISERRKNNGEDI